MLLIKYLTLGYYRQVSSYIITPLAKRRHLIYHFDLQNAARLLKIYSFEGHIMRHIVAYYWKHWTMSTIGLTVNTLAVNKDVFHEQREEQQNLRQIIPLHTNAVFALIFQRRRTNEAFASSQEGFAQAPSKGCVWVMFGGEGSTAKEQNRI